MSTQTPYKVLPNLVATEFLKDATAPWDNKEPVPAFGTKAEYREWQTNASTKYSFFTLWEGVNPTIRTNKKENPATVCHGIVADYDYKKPDPSIVAGLIDTLNDRQKTPHPPFAWNFTFSGGVRMVWLFEEGVPFTEELWAAFFEKAKEEIRWDKLYPSADEEAMKNPHQTYCSGNDWRIVGNKIKRGVVLEWVHATEDKVNWKASNTFNIPLSVVEKELSGKYGTGFWPGSFELGSRGTRFWDKGDAVSVVLREGGFQCYTGDKPFISWADEELLGYAFAKQYRENVLGTAVEAYWHESGSNTYWGKGRDGFWYPNALSVLKEELHLIYGLAPKPPKGEPHSEVALAVSRINQRKIRGTIAIAGQKGSIVYLDDGQYINTCTTKLVTPAPEKKEWGQDFPWIASWFDKFCQEKEARDHLLAWVAHVYRTRYHGTDERFQNILLVGAPGSGKTLFSRAVLGELLGGACDASGYFTGTTVFNAHMANSLVWSLDDPSTGGDRRQLLKLTEQLKSMAANPTMAYNRAYGSKKEIPFRGVVVMSINDDVDSLHSLPTITDSIKDKLNVYRISSHKPDLSADRGANNRMIANELPAFASYLLHTHTNAERIKTHSRFGIDVYHDKGILEVTQENTYQNMVEALVIDWANARALNPENKEVRATTTEILNDILEGPGTKGAGRGLGVRSLGLTLTKLAEEQDWIIQKKVKTPAGSRRAYIVDLDKFRAAAVDSD